MWAPDPLVLGALAKLYKVPIEGLLALLRRNREDQSLEALPLPDGADGTEAVFAGPEDEALSADERACLDLWRRLSPEDRQLLIGILERLASGRPPAERAEFRDPVLDGDALQPAEQHRQAV